jgi:hypothetical protein
MNFSNGLNHFCHKIETFLTIHAHGKSFGAKSDTGFQDCLSDCQTGTSNAINGHSNAGHHSAAYMDAYNRGLASCNTGSNAQPGNTGSNKICNAVTSLVGGLLGNSIVPGVGAGIGASAAQNLC